jgi:hypothetical protein
MRDEPVSGATATLVIELAEAGSREDVEAVVSDHGGSVKRDLQVADLAVELPEVAVASLCELPDIERIETTGTLSQAPPGAEE